MGNIIFQEQKRNMLPEGTYAVHARQSLTADKTKGAGQALNVSYENNMTFIVGSERFRLGEKIISMSPADGSDGSYETWIPNIVIDCESMLRGIDGLEAYRIPGAILMLFYEEEEIRMIEDTLANLLAKQKDVYIPALTVKQEAGENQEDVCRCLDIPVQLFADTFPATEELPYLIHTRKTDLINKAVNSTDDSRCYTCITANRLPSAEGRDNVKNTACLVSLEGYEEYLRKQDTALFSGFTRVRMILLHQFSFYVNKEQNDFASSFKNLSVDILKRPDSEESARFGYTRLPYVTQGGAAGSAFYHGPCVPYRAGTVQPPPIREGIDITYDSAYQLGRLSALADQTLIKWILACKRSMKHQQLQTRRNVLLPQRFIKQPGITKVQRAQEICGELTRQLKESISFPPDGNGKT